MSSRKKPGNLVQHLFRKLRQLLNALTKACVNWILRSLLRLQRRSRLPQAGFVLPTVVMVVLVVILLTTAIMFRSFDRSKNASNYRVDEAVLNAATPALDRARAKLDRLFSGDENDLIGNLPAENNIAEVFADSEYTFGDEVPIKLINDFLSKRANPGDTQNRTRDGKITEPEEVIQTAWKFPVDTDNNGLFDSFTLYGMYFRNPPEKNGKPMGARVPLEARTLPMDDGAASGCGSGSAGGEQGWYPIGGKLKKAFFTYVATVPITTKPTTPYKGTSTTIPANKFEPYKGNKGFSALEMQQDQARIALDNNAVWFEDDLEITNVPDFRLNGRVHTNGNLMVANPSGSVIKFYQVSSPWSCYYDPENAKIIVGGNVTAGGIASTSDSGNNQVNVHLYKEREQAYDENANSRAINANNKTTQANPPEVADNSEAFSKRLNVLIEGVITQLGTNPVNGANISGLGFPVDDKKEVKENFLEKCPNSKCTNPQGAFRQTLETYFKARIRRVPFKEVPINDTTDKALGGRTKDTVFAGQIIPPPEWMQIQDNQLPLEAGGGQMKLATTDPDLVKVNGEKIEFNIGDRIQVGNGLPNRWWDGTKYAEAGAKQDITGINWNDQAGTGTTGSTRTRSGLVEQLDDLGDTSRSGYWERAATKVDDLAGEKLAGGLRVVTGAGIYVDGYTSIGNVGTGKRLAEATYAKLAKSFLPPPPQPTQAQIVANNPGALRLPRVYAPNPNNKAIVVWPDSMPMYSWLDNPPKTNPTPGANDLVLKGDLQMRATVVYHYASGDRNNPTKDALPIACISSYYDPTNSITAQNEPTLPGGVAGGMSNNGINYPPPTSRTITPRLQRQANMVFPDGRLVNPALNAAIGKSPTDYTLQDIAAIDAANCALSILDGAKPSASLVPNFAIRERAFLDARQVKSLHKPDRYTYVDASGNTQTQDLDRITKLVNINDPNHLKLPELVSLNGNDLTKTTAPDYDLPLEQRQPLEIRVTEIDLGAIKNVSVAPNNGGGGANDNEEFLLPNSGIIYATRDDALPDISDQTDRPNSLNLNSVAQNLTTGSSATDFRVDHTRRPMGIRLVNGSDLARKQRFRTAEKGLILASDLPVYIKGDFNLHKSAGAAVEEFTTLLAADYGNFYTRLDTQKDKRFACRIQQGDCANQGDRWRAARILSDAITLLSDDFRDGYRDEGNYDQNNNAGNSAVEKRLNNGFWWNSFATTSEWYDATGMPRTDFAADLVTGKQVGSSYVMNDVTPIQRRVKFPVYKMEICRKLPGSDCAPSDWVTTGAGTTATLPPIQSDRRYPRRVAFDRDPSTHQLQLDANGYAKPLPGPATAQIPTTYQDSRSTFPQDNALWFATSKFPNRPNDFDPTTGTGGYTYEYDADGPLYYLPDEPETPTADVPVVHERQLLLPGTPKFPDELSTIAALKGATSLNGIGLEDPSDYALCIRQGSSKNPSTTGLSGPQCPGSTLNNIEKMRTALAQLSATSITTPGVIGPPTPTTFTPGSTTPIPATAKVNLVELPRNLTGTITLNRGNQSNPIFVLRKTTGNFPLVFNAVNLDTGGVDPNNIFWVSNVGMQFQGANTLAGNFLGGNGRLRINSGSTITGKVRFLGFTLAGGGGSNLNGATISAMTATYQPLLLPILQLHSPEGIPGNNPFASSEHLEDKWLPHAVDTTFNASFIMGNTPSRPFPGNTVNPGESGGGLHNFPRFLEAWEKKYEEPPSTSDNLQDTKIRGSFIQFKRSVFATAPFETIDDSSKDNSLFFDGATPAYIAGFTNPNYRYRGGAQGQRAPYYKPPERLWGYDVGLLSQTPDLFARRFATPTAGTPNEFYREVQRDDEWIKPLLCAAEQSNPNSTNPTYNAFAIPDPKQRPASCPPLTQYNTPTGS